MTDENGNILTHKYYSNKGIGTEVPQADLDNKGNPKIKIKPFVYVDKGNGKGLVKFIPENQHGSWHTETAIAEAINQKEKPIKKIRVFSKNSPCVGMCLHKMMSGFDNAEVKIAFDKFYDKLYPEYKETISEKDDYLRIINRQLEQTDNKVQFYQFHGKIYL